MNAIARMVSRMRLKRSRRLGLLRDRRGATAVEFALVAPLFLVFMFSTFEVGWYYFVNSTVDAATINLARFVRTGQAQKAGYSKDDFFAKEACPKLEYFGDCENRLTAEVQTFNTFAELAADNTPITCRDADPSDVQAIPYDPGTDNVIVRIRICLIYDTINPVIGINNIKAVNLSEGGAGRRHLTATFVFRNEPYSKNKKSLG